MLVTMPKQLERKSESPSHRIRYKTRVLNRVLKMRG